MDCGLVKTFCSLPALKKRFLNGKQRQLRKGLSVTYRQRYGKRYTPIAHGAITEYSDLPQRSGVQNMLLQRIHPIYV